MRLNSRLKTLEKASGLNNPHCHCKGFTNDVKYIKDGEPKPKAQTCATCKKERQLILIIGVKSKIPVPEGGRAYAY